MQIPKEIEQIFKKPSPDRTADESKFVENWLKTTVFNKPGREWEPDELALVMSWINTNPQLESLQNLARSKFYNRGYCCLGPEDAKETWAEFCNKPVGTSDLSRLVATIRYFDPTKPNSKTFWNYLLWCFEQFCVRYGGKIEKMRHRTDGDQLDNEETNDERRHFVLVDPTEQTPAEYAEDKDFKEFLKRFKKPLLDCLNKLTRRSQLIIDMLEVKELSHMVISDYIGVSEAACKTAACRARQSLLKCLKKKGVTKEGVFYEGS